MSYTMEDFERDYFNERFERLTPSDLKKVFELLPPEQQRALLQLLPAAEKQRIYELFIEQKQREWLQTLPLEVRLAGLTDEQIQQYLDQRTTSQPTKTRKQRRKS